jgi:CRISPR-associated protein Csd2
MMACQGLYIFSHESNLGNAPAHRLFERVRVDLKSKETPPRHFHDYAVEVDEDASLPNGVTLTRLAI